MYNSKKYYYLSNLDNLQKYNRDSIYTSLNVDYVVIHFCTKDYSKKFEDLDNLSKLKLVGFLFSLSSTFPSIRYELPVSSGKYLKGKSNFILKVAIRDKNFFDLLLLDNDDFVVFLQKQILSRQFGNKKLTKKNPFLINYKIDINSFRDFKNFFLFNDFDFDDFLVKISVIFSRN